ncbi:MAG: hypothetical protein V1857_01580 [archaeon]
MEEDERLRELKKYLSSTLEEFESLIHSSGDFDDTRIGNGWDPSRIQESLAVLLPISLDKLVKRLEPSGLNRLSRLVWMIRGRPLPRFVIKSSTCAYVPCWIVEGFHECYFFRTTSYQIPTKEDVVAVEVEGTLRNLVVQDPKPSTLLSALKLRIDRIAGLITGAPRYFVLDGVTELARNYEQARACLDRLGRPDRRLEQVVKGNQPYRSVRDYEELRQQIDNSEIRSSEVSKEAAIMELHKRIVLPPQSFTRILTNRFEITNATLIHLPVVRIEYSWNGETEVVEVDGLSGNRIEA